MSDIDKFGLHSISASSFLSYGPEGVGVVLRDLNVIIGPNGAGKSNLIELLALMRSSPKDMLAVIRKGGGTDEWIWKGSDDRLAKIQVSLYIPTHAVPIYHRIVFAIFARSFGIVSERIESADLITEFVDRASINTAIVYSKGNARVYEIPDQYRSILYEVRDPDAYPELSYFADIYEKIRIYRDWAFGRNTIFRTPQPSDARNDYLEEDFSNLGLILNRLRKNPKTKRELLQRLSDLYTGITDFDISVEGGTVQVLLTEGEYTIPATRLSDGTLRYLCLLAILCDPNPPPLICIEEPELGLHPDIIPKIADLLKEASERTQLIVTTHSDILIDAMSDRPECVLVCEKHEGQTTVNRLDKEELAVWLEKYRLGELWTSGQIGGNRW